jgi:hypothetical protein
MARKHARKRRRNVPVYRWDTARPYMGLTQACQTLRNEFRPMYLSTLRWSMNFQSLPGVLDLFGPADMKRDLGGMLDDLRQMPLPPAGIDLLELIRISRIHQDKVRLKCGWTAENNPVSIAGYLIIWWLQLGEDNTSTMNRITDVRLQLRPDEERPPNEKPRFDTVLRITIPVHGNSERNLLMADSFGKIFMKMTHCTVVFELFIIEVHCGDRRKSWKIDRKAWPMTSEIVTKGAN